MLTAIKKARETARKVRKPAELRAGAVSAMGTDHIGVNQRMLYPAPKYGSQDGQVIDDWYLEFINSTYTKSSEDVLGTLTLQYHMAKDQSIMFATEIYNYTCSSLGDLEPFDKNFLIVPAVPPINYDKYYESYDIRKEVEDSSYWYDKEGTDNKEAEIKFCVKGDIGELDADSNYMSVSFVETQVILHVNMEAGFSSFTIDDVEVSKNAPSLVEETSETTVTACVCSPEKECIESPVLPQNSALNVCVTPDSEDYIIMEFEELKIYQGGTLKFTPVDAKAPTSSITTIDLGEGGDRTGVVQTRMISSFFESSNPESVSISGKVLLDFDTRRNLGASRALVGRDSDVAHFELRVGLEQSSYNNSLPSSTTLGIYLLLQIIVYAFFVAHRRRGDRNVVVRSDSDGAE